MPFLRLPSFALCLCGLASLATAPTPAQSSPPEWLVCQKLPKGKQADVHAQVFAALPAHPWIAALTSLASDASKPATERTKLRAARRGKRTVEFPLEVPPLPQRCGYVFGVGAIEDRDPTHPARPVAAPGKEKEKEKERAEATDLVPVQQALLGCVPDADRALAVILQRLDGDTTADSFAAFLHSWRNGDESFYEALDRTAGTKDSVFFFDAMLDDFRGQFGGSHGDPALRGLQPAHDALHAAFLAYRQYRGFREAVAWSLVLPPDRPLPARLARYEAKAAGAYSLREQVTMVAAVMDHDVGKVVAAISAAAAPLPQPLWRGAYDPYPAWNATFTNLLPTMIERAGSSDAFLLRAREERHGVAATIAAASRQSVLAASGSGH